MLGVVERSQYFGFALKPGQSFGVRGKRVRQDLDGDLALQVRVGGLVHLTHATDANSGGDFIRTETGARGQRHCRAILVEASPTTKGYPWTSPFNGRHEAAWDELIETALPSREG
jgi:hypothetical protein